MFQALTPDRKCFWLKADQQFEKIIGTKEEKEATVFTIKGKCKNSRPEKLSIPLKSEHMQLLVLYVIHNGVFSLYFVKFKNCI